MKIVNKFQLKIVIFTAEKNRCILHGRDFVMRFVHTSMDFKMNGIVKCAGIAHSSFYGIYFTKYD